MTKQSPPLILVAESTADVRDSLTHWLRERGNRVAGAATGAEALELVGLERPDVVLLDHELAGIGGMEVLDRLRTHDELAAVPVIMLTRSGHVELMLEAMRRGAHDYVLKPVDAAQLDARLLVALRVKRLHDALLEANRRLARQALTDDLTGIANRRHGGRQLEREIALCVRHGRLLALARVDIDHFKEINDSHGHETGDHVLAEVARRLTDGVRGGDELARWGGDEFVVILPDTDKPGALRAAERLREAVSASPIAIEGQELDVTVSVGWAHWAGDTPDDLLARADRALYRAKDRGRDQVFPPQASGPQG